MKIKINSLVVLIIVQTLFFVACTGTQKNGIEKSYDLIIGTYTNESTSEGIYVYSFNSETGELDYKNKTTDIENPSYITLSPDLKNIYAVSEFGSDSIGMVYAYSYDAKDGSFNFQNKVSAGGEGPCYVSTDHLGQYVFTANYGSGSLAAVPVLEDGSLSSDIQEIYNKPTVINDKEGSSRMHAVVISPDNKYLFAPNLGIDKIGIYPFNENASNNPLVEDEIRFQELPDGSGPRHFVFHPNENHAYLIQEISGAITVFDYNNGVLSEKQVVSILPDDFEGKFAAADIHISPDGKFLYGSNRIDLNEIVIFRIDEKTGQLSFVSRASSEGTNPRNFAIDPSGNFLLVANQESNEIVVFKRNQKTGLITATNNRIEIGKPVCLEFVY